MPRTMPVDTQWQNFWKESIHNETETRMRWALKFDNEFHKMINDPQLADFKVPCDRFNVKKVPTIEHPSTSYVIDKQYHMKKQPPPPPIPKKPDSGVSLDMYPPDPATKALLYDGISYNGEGRYQYLRARNKLYPDQRFPFEVCSSWQYGWGGQDAPLRGPKHATIAVVNETFYRKNGLHWIRDQAKKEGRVINTLEKE
ncbi:protein ATP6V1FNB-like [Amphibalanus amphitrite]|uniref:protein ATP6V1FNB-like n=1 Tax=Amphibalanus amphitrite TaxID=1232801 RepID=UPI001C918400|nr:protein ATP6V1FNB-like [Amphibalanus amphitrite]